MAALLVPLPAEAALPPANFGWSATLLEAVEAALPPGDFGRSVGLASPVVLPEELTGSVLAVFRDSARFLACLAASSPTD
jgi:hypothetical protein